MNSIDTPARPLALLAAIAQFFRESIGARNNRVEAPATNGPDLMQLYRLARGRDTIHPAIGALLAKTA